LIRGVLRAEDGTDEHCGVESHAPIAKPLLLVLLFFVLAAVCRA
jgi:hypothetical protein